VPHQRMRVLQIQKPAEASAPGGNFAGVIAGRKSFSLSKV
jgi:hypothetical protein